MTSLFENINEKNIERLKRILRSTSVIYRKGVNILSNVNREDFIAIVDAGSVQLEYNDYEGNKIIMEDLGPGEIFGTLTSALRREEVSCIAKEETQIKHHVSDRYQDRLLYYLYQELNQTIRRTN